MRQKKDLLLKRGEIWDWGSRAEGEQNETRTEGYSVGKRKKSPFGQKVEVRRKTGQIAVYDKPQICQLKKSD